MEAMFKEAAGYIALALEAIATLMIACGALIALITLLRPSSYNSLKPFTAKRKALLTLGAWLLLGLQFELGADIVRSAISPTWTQIGELAAIAVIRTFLNYFLERDVENLIKSETTGGATRGDEAGVPLGP